MRPYIDRILSYIAPNQCMACGIDDALLCRNCLPLMPDAESLCYRCGAITLDFTTCNKCRASTGLNSVICGTDYEFFGKQLVHDLKFKHAIEAARLMAQHLARAMGHIPENTCLVPVPTATGRVRERGFDQAILIAKELSRVTRHPYANLLVRNSSVRQTSLSRAERLRNKEILFTFKTKRNQNISSILLVDDVISTGATLEAAARACSENGIERISAAVFAANR